VKKLSQYCGPLTSEQIALGINAALQNSSRLAKDAATLLSAGRFPSACSLAILSLEESGKPSILRGMATARSQTEITGLWKSYRRHLDKHLLTLGLQRFAQGERLLIGLREYVSEETADEKATYDAIKQLGFYTDCLGKAHWSVPLDVVGEELARNLVTLATAATSGSHNVTTREIELWTIHMQGGLNRKNLLAWAAAMEAENFHPAGYAAEMIEFTRGLS
jgi:AbiV family abortive infection protein